MGSPAGYWGPSGCSAFCTRNAPSPWSDPRLTWRWIRARCTGRCGTTGPTARDLRRYRCPQRAREGPAGAHLRRDRRPCQTRPRAASTPTGGRPTTCRSARSTCSTTRCCASRCWPSTSSRGCSATGARRPGSTCSTPTSTGSIIAARPGRDLRHRARATAARAWSPTPAWRAPTARSTRTIGRDEDGHARRCSASSPSPAASPATSRRRRPGSIHEGGELGYALVHAYGAAFDNPDLLVACVVGDGEAETGPLAASWHSNKFLNPATRRRGAADPAPQRLQDRQPDGAGPHPRGRAGGAAARLRLRAVLRRRATTRRPCTSCWPPRSTRCSTTSPRSSARRASRAVDRQRAALADDRAAHAEGLDRPEGGRRPAGRGHVPLPPGAAGRRPAPTPSTARSSRQWMRSYRPEELFDDDGRLVAGAARRWRPTGDRRMSANPHANGGAAAARPAPARLPRLRRRRSTRPARRVERGDPGARRAACATSSRANPRHVPGHRPRRDRLQPAAARLRGDRPGLGRRDRCPATTTSPRTAG